MTVTLATFMEVLDTSIANVALPHIAGNLSISQDEATWVLTSYLVANADGFADQRVALHQVRPQAFLHDVRGAVRRQFADVRPGSELAGAGFLPYSAGTGRRRTRSHRTSHLGRHVRSRKTWPGVFGLRHGGGGRRR